MTRDAGTVGHDFGDAIRFAANYVEEDCPDAGKAGLNMEVFRAFAEGFLRHTASALTEKEIETLPLELFRTGLRAGDTVSGRLSIGKSIFRRITRSII